MDDVVRVAALVSCNLGLSTFEWSKKIRLCPISIELRGVRVLALAHPGVLDPIFGCKLYLAKRHKIEQYMLLARYPSSVPRYFKCFFPHDITWEEGPDGEETEDEYNGYDSD